MQVDEGSFTIYFSDSPSLQINIHENSVHCNEPQLFTATIKTSFCSLISQNIIWLERTWKWCHLLTLMSWFLLNIKDHLKTVTESQFKCLVPNVLPNNFYCVPRKKRNHTGFKIMRVSKWWWYQSLEIGVAQ